GDRWLLCSDGLSGVVSHETIAETLTREPDPARCAEELIDLALRGGGPDNVTCVIWDLLDADPLPAGAVPATAPHVARPAATHRLRGTRGTPGAAGRAAALTPAATQEDEQAPEPPRRRRWLGATLLTVLVLGLLTLGGWFGYRWTQTQYYLAPAGEVVAIYRGIPQQVGPVTLSEVHTRTDLRLTE